MHCCYQTFKPNFQFFIFSTMATLLQLCLLAAMVSGLFSSPLKHQEPEELDTFDMTNSHRARRSLRIRNDRLQVSVDLAKVTISPGRSVTVRCRAKGGIQVDDQPYVSFYVSVTFFVILKRKKMYFSHQL